MLLIKQCDGNGLGSCTSCERKGVWNRTWMCFLYKIDGIDGIYCAKCLKEILAERKETCDKNFIH